MVIPDVINDIYNQISDASPSELCIRALTDIDGGLGETYVMLDADTLFLISKSIGGEFQPYQFDFSSISNLNLKEDRPFAQLNLAAGGKSYSLKFSSMDLDELAQIENKVSGKEFEAHSSSADPKVAKKVELNPLVGFAASLYVLSQVDGSMDKRELDIINRVVSTENSVAALDYLHQQGPLQLIESLKKMLDEKQKLCLMANLLELSMSDLVIKKDEKEIIRQFKDALQIDDSDYQAIYDVLMLKNNTGVFTD